MGRVKRSNALSWIFMRYVLVMLGSLVGLVIVAWLLLYLLISVGCIYPANYAEQKINEAYDTILRADKVTAEMIPALCDYVIFSENFLRRNLRRAKALHISPNGLQIVFRGDREFRFRLPAGESDAAVTRTCN